MDKRLFVHLQGGRKVSGTLRGYDLFLNLVIDDAQEETTPAQRHPIGTVVRTMDLFLSATVCPLMHMTRSSAGTVLPQWRLWKR
jgi:small nuclear ribonucleoprotein (snRNP)-like protein